VVGVVGGDPRREQRGERQHHQEHQADQPELVVYQVAEQAAGLRRARQLEGPAEQGLLGPRGLVLLVLAGGELVGGARGRAHASFTLGSISL
jgi:hypothetical protein